MKPAIAVSSVLALALGAGASQAQPMGRMNQAPMNRSAMSQRGPRQMGAGQMGPGAAMPARDFVRVAMQSNRFEREAGELAVRRGQDPRVKQFGRRMIRDHLRLGEALTRAVRRSGMPVRPTPQVERQQQQILDQLSAAPPRAFDRAYIDSQVQAHQTALQLMQTYASNGSDPALRRAAAQAVPIIQEHLQIAQQIQGSVGGM